MTIYGVDASDYDADRGPMDMAAMARDGIVFVTHKLTEGASVRHTRGGTVLAAARTAGIPFLGGYMVPRTPGPSISAQVDYCLAWADTICPWWKMFPGWFWQMDTEHWGYDQVSADVGHQAAQLLSQRGGGRRVLHYAPQWAYGNGVPGGEPLWASSYVTGSGPYRSLYPGDGSSRWGAYSGRTPVVLQYTSSATVGSQPGCDANAFRGTVADFAALIGAGGSGGMEQSDIVQGWAGKVRQIPLGWGLADGFNINDFWRNLPGEALVAPQRAGSRLDLLMQAVAKIDTLVAAAAADATRDAAAIAAISTMADMIRAGGGSVDAAAILDEIHNQSEATRALVEQRHAEEMAALRAQHNAEVAGLQAELDALRAS